MTLDINYIQTDFKTLVQNLKEQFKNSEIFTDVDYEGSNISALIELLAYNGELTTFFVNKIAQNMNDETANIYETAHALAKRKGYDPKGYRSSRATLNVMIDNTTGLVAPGDVLLVAPWLEVVTAEEYEGTQIVFSTIQATTYTPTVSGNVTFTVPVRQGKVRTYTYKGRDIVNNELLLPNLKYAYDDDIDDYKPSMDLTVNDIAWHRVSNFYDEISGLDEETTKIFKYEFDKYQRNKLIFSSNFSVPAVNDDLVVTMLETLGENGNVASNTITKAPQYFIYNMTKSAYVDNTKVTVLNLGPSSGGESYESITTIRDNARAQQHAQYRNVTKQDFRTYLKTRSDVKAANVWGEQDISPSGGDTYNYHKLYISVIPDTWSNDTIQYNTSTVIRSINSIPVSAGIIAPSNYADTYLTTLKTYLEPRKMLNMFEIYTVPKLIYFFFDIELKVKRLYDLSLVQRDVKNKLIYYFEPLNRSFGESIDFIDIKTFLLDSTIISETDSFTNIKGLDGLVFRDVISNAVIYEPNSSLSPRMYPQYDVSQTYWTGDNKLRIVKLDFDQFPMLLPQLCNFYIAS